MATMSKFQSATWPDDFCLSRTKLKTVEANTDVINKYETGLVNLFMVLLKLISKSNKQNATARGKSGINQAISRVDDIKQLMNCKIRSFSNFQAPHKAKMKRRAKRKMF